MAKATWRLAASAMGPSGQCGARWAPKVSASEAIRVTSDIPPAARQVRLGHGDARGQHREEVGPSVEPFAGGQRHGRGGDQAGQQVGLLGQDGFLDEQRVQRGHLVEYAARVGGAEAAVEVDGDVAVRAKGLAGGRHALDDGSRLGGAADRRGAPGGVHLDGGEPGLHLGGDLLLEPRGFVAADPGVHPDGVADRAAEQGVHRHPEGAARDVPQGLVDAG